MLSRQQKLTVWITAAVCFTAFVTGIVFTVLEANERKDFREAFLDMWVTSGNFTDFIIKLSVPIMLVYLYNIIKSFLAATKNIIQLMQSSLRSISVRLDNLPRGFSRSMTSSILNSVNGN